MASRKKSKNFAAPAADLPPGIILPPEARQRLENEFLKIQNLAGTKTEETRSQSLKAIASIVEVYFSLRGEEISPEIQAALEQAAE